LFVVWWLSKGPLILQTLSHKFPRSLKSGHRDRDHSQFRYPTRPSKSPNLEPFPKHQLISQTKLDPVEQIYHGKHTFCSWSMHSSPCFAGLCTWQLTLGSRGFHQFPQTEAAAESHIFPRSSRVSFPHSHITRYISSTLPEDR